MRLKPFQATAVSHIVETLKARGSFYLQDEMGLGKTVQAIAVAQSLPAFRVTVICPKSVELNWYKEFSSWSTIGFDSQLNLEVFSYYRAVKDANKVPVTDLLIIDEAHYLKNIKAQRTKVILKTIWPKAKYKLCLSGTPMTKHVGDLFPLYYKMSPSSFKDYWAFLNRYSNRTHTPFGIKYEGVRNAAELKAIAKPFTLRRLLKDVAKELPEKTYQCVPVPEAFAEKLSQEEQELHDKYVEELRALLQRADQNESTFKPPVPPVSIMNIRKRQGLKKVPFIVDFCKEILDQEIPMVLFAVHKEVIASLELHLESYSPVTIDGSVNTEDRQWAVDRFQKGDTNLFIGQLYAAGVGITLNRAHIGAYAELDWNSTIIDQSSSRLLRIGQTQPVTMYYFETIGSKEAGIWRQMLKKQKLIEEVING